MEEIYDNNEDDKMPKTYDQTSITYRKDKCEISYGPRPVPPPNAELQDDGIVRAYFYERFEVRPYFWDSKNTLYEWYPDGDVIRYNDDGSQTVWYTKPTMQDALAKTGQYHRFYADGSCMLRYHDGAEQRTLFYGEDREVDEPCEDNWINDYDRMLGRHHPDLLDDGWYCMKCYTKRCEHVSREKKRQFNNEESS